MHFIKFYGNLLVKHILGSFFFGGGGGGDRESSKLGHSKSDIGVHFGQSIENVSHQLQNRNASTTQEILQIEDEDS